MLSGCSLSGSQSEGNSSQPKGKAYFSYFDTVSYIYSYANDTEAEFEKNAADVSALLSDYHKLFDIYHEYADVNNLCTINMNAGEAPIKVDSRLIDFLEYAKEMYDATDYEMNIMLGSVLNIWHNYRTIALDDSSKAEVPTQAELQEAAKHTSFDSLVIDKENSTVYIKDSSASIDVGALGKGYATEKAAQLLIDRGVTNYVLNVGGNIRTIGTKPNGDPWTSAIKDPMDPDNAFALKVNLSNCSCVTSGNYERYYVVGGNKYHHIIDKDTLNPADYFASVTIISTDSGLADALSTALFCMPYEQGLEIANNSNVDVIWIYADGTISYTNGIENLICK